MRLGILCSGQGNQHPGMFDRLAGNAAAGEIVRQAQAVSAIDLREADQDAIADIFANRIAQPLICAVELATWAALSDCLPAPLLFAGYSVGELAAYACAGALDASETVRLAQRRAALMDGANPAGSGLLAITGSNRAAVDALCRTHDLHIAIINGREHFVLGGTLAALASAAAARNIRRLPVSTAAHTPLLAAAVAPFAAELEQSPLTTPRVPVLAGIDGRAVRDRATALATLSAQIAQTVQWSACMEAAIEMGADVFLELGPGCALARMARAMYPERPARSVAEFHSLRGVADWVEKLS